MEFDIQKELINRYNDVTVNTLLEQVKSALLLQAKFDLSEAINQRLAADKNALLERVAELEKRMPPEELEELIANHKQELEAKDRLREELVDGFTKKQSQLNDLLTQLEEKAGVGTRSVDVPMPVRKKVVSAARSRKRFVDNAIDLAPAAQTHITLIQTDNNEF
jgi:hypothetical protein